MFRNIRVCRARDNGREANTEAGDVRQTVAGRHSLERPYGQSPH